MENKRKALGRGLEQLFSNESIYVSDENKVVEENVENNNEESTEKDNENVILVNIKDLRPNPYQPRRKFDEDKLVELAASIEEHGIIEPIIVKKSIKGYELIAGERRMRACEFAGIDQIPAIVKDFTDEQMMQVALLENIQREDLTSIEEAEAYSKLLKSLNITHDELAKKVGKSRSHITNLLGLLKLPQSVKQDIIDNKISLGHAKILSKLENDETIIELCEKIKNEDLSVRSVEFITSNPEMKRKKEIKINKIPNKYKIVEETMREIIGTNVKVKNNNVIIPFDSEKDLERILDIINIKVKVD